jgi:hypothetical protein
MKWIRLFAVAGLLLGASATAASADSTAPLTGLEAICIAQDGDWWPNGFPGFEHPACTDVGLVVWQDVSGSFARNQLAAADSLCKAAGFDGVELFGKGIVDEQGRIGFFVETWACVGVP